MKFKIEDIGVKDAGKGFARISSTIMHEIGIEPLDVVEIYGKRKSAIRIMPASDSNNDSIKIDRSLDPSNFNKISGYKPKLWSELIKSMHEFNLSTQ